MRLAYDLPDPGATDALAQRIAPLLASGDTLLLAGPIGAGKTHFARALIRARLGREEEVPSPTYTLVQTYDDGALEIWHADLYRLSGRGEAQELGLDDAFATAICLVEWPDRLRAPPPGALTLTFSVEGSGRSLLAEGPEEWRGRLPQAQDA